MGNKHRNVHDSQMKPWFPPCVGKSWPIHFTMLTDKSQPGDAAPDEWEAEKIIRWRTRTDGQKEFLVRWKGFTSDDDTWELAQQFLPRYNKIWVQFCRKHKISVPFEHMFEQSR